MPAEDFDVDIDLHGNSLLNARLQVLSSDPSPSDARIYINSTDNPQTLRFYDGDAAAWITLGTVPTYTGGDAITITAFDIDVNVAGGAGGIEINSDALRISAAAAGNGLTGGAGSALAVGAGTGITVNANDVAVDTSVIAARTYVDAAIQGLSPKDSARVATTGNIAIATALNNLDVIDGITLATGDRVLVKDQTAPAENGIYIVAASPVRADDASTWDELVGAWLTVEQGTVNADTTWLCTSDRSGTLGTTAVTWTAQPNLGSLVAGDGLDKTGNTIDVDATVVRTTGAQNIAGVKSFTDHLGVVSNSASSAITGENTSSGDGVRGLSSTGPAFAVDATHGSGPAFDGRGQGSVVNIIDGVNDDDGATLAQSGRPFKATFGNGVDTEYTINHALGTRDVIVEVYNLSGFGQYETRGCRVERTDANNVKLIFNAAPSTNTRRVLIRSV